ncbi:methyltransferase, MtaA/CmuA family [Candidatus Vecturithrix granuli]|uniref:Methyltransferase, MtaA/CmuA family n=1 Tax=Vecturithrix granuli TaxID=1499967 RepID=A0A081BXY0_VECG1|nr:methyltransferase, MtaA/CmuA family [Candidatus Vecturithrix granuli]
MIDGRFHKGYERLQKAGEGIPDCVPFTSQMHEFAMAWSGTSGSTFYTDASALVAGIVKTAEDFDFDIPGLGYDVYNIEAEALGQQLIFNERQTPAINTALRLLKEKKHLLSLKPPIPGSSGRMPFVLNLHRLYRERTGISPAIQFCAPFSLAVLLRGYEDFILDMYEDLEFAHELLTFLTEEVIAPWINFQQDEFPESTSAIGADALCSPPMVNTKLIKNFSIPYIRRLRELCRRPVSVINWWGESHVKNPIEFLTLKLEVASGLIRAQDPDVALLGPEIFKEFAVKHNVVLELGVGDGILNWGSEEEIRNRIRHYIQKASPGGKFILYLTSLDADTPPENIKLAVSTIREYGKY